MINDGKTSGHNLDPRLYRTNLDDYAERWKHMAHFRREDSILELRLHKNDGPFQWGVDVHRNFAPMFMDIANDPDNEVLILTGTGDSFIAERDNQNWSSHGYAVEAKAFSAHAVYEHWYNTQPGEVFALLNMPIPIIAAVNGPHRIHHELSLVADIVVAAETTYYQDVHSFQGVVPGDGAQILWRELLGPNRGRAFLITSEKLYADEAHRLGVVHKVLPLDKVLEEAWRIARETFMTQPRTARRMTHSLLIQPWRRLFEQELQSGLAHEALAGRDERRPQVWR